MPNVGLKPKYDTHPQNCHSKVIMHRTEVDGWANIICNTIHDNAMLHLSCNFGLFDKRATLNAKRPLGRPNQYMAPHSKYIEGECPHPDPPTPIPCRYRPACLLRQNCKNQSYKYWNFLKPITNVKSPSKMPTCIKCQGSNLKMTWGIKKKMSVTFLVNYAHI